jgi:hypothetical protein
MCTTTSPAVKKQKTSTAVEPFVRFSGLLLAISVAPSICLAFRLLKFELKAA